MYTSFAFSFSPMFDYSLSSMNMNDKISSLKIGENVRLLLCDNVNCEGNWDTRVDIIGPYQTPMLDAHNDMFS
jgi:hypothetical protein